nr:MAG TPA: hypothetical protein [Caudoviricetes sp.]
MLHNPFLFFYALQFFAVNSMVSWLCMPIHICSKLQFLLSYNTPCRLF